MHKPLPVLLLCCSLLVACGDAGTQGGTAAQAPSVQRPAVAKSRNAQSQELERIVEEYYDRHLELNPLQATAEGDHRYDDRLGDYLSEKWLADSLWYEQEALERLGRVNAEELDDEDLVTYEAFRYGRRIAIEGFRYPGELLPVHQFSSLPVTFAMLGSGEGIHPFHSVQDYDNFLSRMDDFVAWVDQAIANMREGIEKGIVQPRVLVERTLPQLTAPLTDDPKQSLFWRPILSFPASLGVSDRKRLTLAFEQKLREEVFPAYRRLHEFLQDEYLPQARDSVGLSELPNGGSWYAYLARLHTGTTMTPEQIHQLGLAEVARIRAEMERVKETIGFEGELQTFFDALRRDPELHFTEAGELIAGYREIGKRVERSLPLLFAVSPRAGFEIRPVEAFRAASEAAASYQSASADGSRLGIFYVNTYELASRPKYSMEALYLHEAVPGHHFQGSLAQEMTTLPRFRRFGWDTAYGEGWALYAESLGSDLGLYTDPYSRFGALMTEMWRAVRLVVDTGLHAKGWSREQAIDYMRANTALGEADIVAEVERYIAWPGQALAYKIGELKIRELRDRAQQKLGPRFDIREFHSQVLLDGSLPLAVLEAKIDRWISTSAR